MFQRSLFFSAFFAVVLQVVYVNGDHTFTFKNNCGNSVTPVVANVNCGYSPRCSSSGSGGVPNPAISFTGAQPHQLGPGQSQTITINRQWNGRIFNQNGHCGASGKSCTMGEFNLDTGNQFTAQAYDISNIHISKPGVLAL